MTTRLGVLALALVATLWASAAASAGTFVVRSCGATTSKNATAWTLDSLGGPMLAAGDSCASSTPDGDGQVSFAGGLWVRDTQPATTLDVPEGRVTGYRFSAPVGATLTRIVYDRSLHSIKNDFTTGLYTNLSSTPVELCAPTTSDSCPESARVVKQFDLPSGATQLDVAVRCVGGVCPSTGGPLYDFAAVIYSSEVTVSESVAPTLMCRWRVRRRAGCLALGGWWCPAPTRLAFASLRCSTVPGRCCGARMACVLTGAPRRVPSSRLVAARRSAGR